MSDDIGFENIASSCRHEYAHYEDEMFRDSFDPEVLLRAADEIDRLTKLLASRKVADNTYVRTEWSGHLVRLPTTPMSVPNDQEKCDE